MKRKRFKSIIVTEDVNDIDSVLKDIIPFLDNDKVSKSNIEDILRDRDYVDFSEIEVDYLYNRLKDRTLFIPKEREEIEIQIGKAIDELLDKNRMSFILDKDIIESDEDYINFVKNKINTYLTL